MKDYEKLEIEVNSIQADDVISTSRQIGLDTPGIGLFDDEDLLS